MSGTEARVRRAVVGDEPILRDIRLQALLDAPDAFASSYERELRRTEADWRGWLAPGATFLLDAHGLPLGIVAAVHDKIEEDVVHLMAMWLAPSLRGTGASQQLVSAVVEWGRSVGARWVRLNVMKTNHRARRLYERCGFVPTGQETSRENDDRVEVRLERPI